MGWSDEVIYDDPADLSDLVGQTLVAARLDATDRNVVELVTDRGERWWLGHIQDCCEDVVLEDVAGDLGDLVGSPLVEAERSTNETEGEDYHETWTFYRFRTAKGSVVLRWYSQSNGYYSESVDVYASQPTA